MSRARWLMLAALAQVVVICGSAARFETVLRTGTNVWLRTAPVDPRDPFRGEYVALAYEAESVPRDLLAGTLAAGGGEAGDRVFAALEVGPRGIANVSSLSNRKPPGGLLLRGRLEFVAEDVVSVDYGIGSYYVPEGEGRAIEAPPEWEGLHVPLEMEVAIGRDGLAVLRGHRLGALGIGVEVEVDDEKVPLRARVRLVNTSKEPVAVVDLPGAGSLVFETGWPRRSVAGDRRAVPPVPKDEDVRLLAPGEMHTILLDLRDPDWVEAAFGDARYVVPVYDPPTEEACRGLREAPRIWHGRLAAVAESISPPRPPR